nr:uncharacterized protein LOC105885258 [Microcebus murinus]
MPFKTPHRPSRLVAGTQPGAQNPRYPGDTALGRPWWRGGPALLSARELRETRTDNNGKGAGTVGSSNLHRKPWEMSFTVVGLKLGQNQTRPAASACPRSLLETQTRPTPTESAFFTWNTVPRVHARLCAHCLRLLLSHGDRRVLNGTDLFLRDPPPGPKHLPSGSTSNTGIKFQHEVWRQQTWEHSMHVNICRNLLKRQRQQRGHDMH